MKNSINDKSAPNQMRVLMKRLREGKYSPNANQETTKHELSVRDMLKITRNPVKLNEDAVPTNTPQDNVPVGQENTTPSNNKETVYDQTQEEEKFRNYFNDMNVDIKFTDLKVYDNLIFWGGTIDGVIQFVYKVTPDEKTTGIEFNYLPDFTADNPDNDLIIEKIESYFDIFYKYWRNNILNTASPEMKMAAE
jgi:hypothetical protein